MPTYQSNLEGMVAYNNNFKRLIFFGAVSFFSLYIYITSRLKNFKKINSGEGDHPQKEIFIEDKKGYTVKKLLLKSFLAFLVGFIASYWYKKKLANFLLQSAVNVMKTGDTMIFSSLPEAFFAYLSVAFYFGLIFSSPVILYFICEHFAKGLIGIKRIYAIILSVIQLLIVVYCIYNLFPNFMKMAIEYSSTTITTLPSLSNYLKTISKLNFYFALLFFTSVAVYYVTKYRVTDIIKFRIYFLIGVIVIGSVFIWSSSGLVIFLMAVVPIIVLFEIGVFLSIMLNRETGNG